jgi:hypothetical protein
MHLLGQYGIMLGLELLMSNLGAILKEMFQINRVILNAKNQIKDRR